MKATAFPGARRAARHAFRSRGRARTALPCVTMPPMNLPRGLKHLTRLLGHLSDGRPIYASTNGSTSIVIGAA